MQQYNRFLSLLLLLAAPVLVSAQNAPNRFLKVDAPYAQQLILQAKAAHPELKKIGLHAIPPGETESAIIANAIPAKIGKISSSRDLSVVASGVPAVNPHSEEGGFFDLALPVASADGHPVGMMVMEIPYRYAETQDKALALGTAIRDEVAAKIPSKQTLFQPVRDQDPAPAKPKS